MGRPTFFLTWSLGTAVGFVVPFFLTWILLDVGVGIAMGDGAVAFLDGPVVFPASLALAFTAGGAGVGLAQWLHVRRDLANAASGWILGTMAGFATLAIVYSLMLGAFGEIAMERFLPRLANETIHNLLGGIVAGGLTWRLALRHRGVEPLEWIPVTAGGLVAAGLTAWLAEVALGMAAGDAAPLGMLVFGGATAWGFQRAMTKAGRGAALPRP